MRKPRYNDRMQAAVARRAAGDKPPCTVRFVEWPKPGPDRLEALKATARNYRELAEITGRPVKRALFIQFAEKREARIAELEAQQQPTLQGLST